MKIKDNFKKVDWYYIWRSYSVKNFFKTLFTECKLFYQRHSWGWDVTDAWNLNNAIAQFTLPKIRYLRKHRHGIPMLCFEEVCEGDPYNASHEETVKADVHWDWVLGELEWMMEQYKEDVVVFLSENGRKRLKRAEELFAKYFGSLWD